MTDIALRDYFERCLAELDRRMTDRFQLSDAAVSKAERTMNDRLNSMNEFREALREQSNKMATQAELEKIDSAVRELQRSKSNLDGRLLIMSGAISILVSLLLIYIAKVLQ